MPKVVNYAARFEFLRRAAFLVVRDQGPHALSRRSVASTLATSRSAGPADGGTNDAISPGSTARRSC